MAITLDATKGAATANSYATVEEADSYFESTFGAEEWADILPADKQKLLITATRMIDDLTTLYSSLDPAQALNFPLDNTSGDDAGDGFDEAKLATIIQAFYVHQNIGEITEGQRQSIQGTSFERIGPTAKSVTGFNPFRRFDGKVLSLLAHYIDIAFKASRG